MEYTKESCISYFRGIHRIQVQNEEESKKLQKLLLQLGFRWQYLGIQHLDKPCICVSHNKNDFSLTYSRVREGILFKHLDHRIFTFIESSYANLNSYPKILPGMVVMLSDGEIGVVLSDSEKLFISTPRRIIPENAFFHPESFEIIKVGYPNKSFLHKVIEGKYVNWIWEKTERTANSEDDSLKSNIIISTFKKFF